MPSVTVCVIFSPIEGVPVGEITLTALTDENWLAVNVIVEPTPLIVGFLIILIWANLVSVGKSFVESSNLA